MEKCNNVNEDASSSQNSSMEMFLKVYQKSMPTSTYKDIHFTAAYRSERMGCECECQMRKTVKGNQVKSMVGPQAIKTQDPGAVSQR